MNNETLLKLLEVRNAIKYDGWIVIPPTGDSDSIEIRVKWYVNGEKYGFTTTFKANVLHLGNLDFTKSFIHEADTAIERLISKGV